MLLAHPPGRGDIMMADALGIRWFSMAPPSSPPA